MTDWIIYGILVLVLLYALIDVRSVVRARREYEDES